MRLAGWMMLGGGMLTGLGAACGYPDFEFRERSDTSTGTETGTSSGTATGGTGGVGGTATTTASPTGTATGGDGGSGNTGGGGPTTCELWGAAVCGTGEKCSVVDEATGAAACVQAGPRGAWAACNYDVECAAGTWCDHVKGTCKPICQTGADCSASGGSCIEALVAPGGAAIPGLHVCTANCDPMNPLTTCNQSPSPVTCIDTLSDGWDCFKSGNKGLLDDCNHSSECAPGYACESITTVIWLCRPWCTSSADCPSSEQCLEHDPPLSYNSTPIGWCVI